MSLITIWKKVRSLAIAKGHNPNQMNRNMQNRRRGWGRMV
jgi:hypothetical protein